MKLDNNSAQDFFAMNWQNNTVYKLMNDYTKIHIASLIEQIKDMNTKDEILDFLNNYNKL